MKKAIFSLFFFTILVKITGLIRELSLSYAYGASSISDAYIISMTIPSVVFSFVGIAISTSYIPVYMKINANENDLSITNRFSSSLINFSFVLSVIIYFISFIYTEQLIRIFASGFSVESIEMAVNFTRITLTSIFVSSIIFVFNGFIQSNNNFNFPSFVSIPVNIVATLLIIISSKTNVIILAWSVVISLVVQLLLLYYKAKKYGFQYKYKLDFKNEYLSQTLIMALPLIIGISVNQINVMVDRTIASAITVGGISALNYANKLNMFVYGTLVIAITTVIFPKLSRFAANNSIQMLIKEASKAISLIILLVLPATVGAMLFNDEIVKLIFLRGEFDRNATQLTSGALFFYSIGMVFVGMREVVSRCFYAVNDTKIPTRNAIVAVIVNIILNLLLSRYIGINGLALATSISAILSAILLSVEFKKRFQMSIFEGMLLNLIKIIGSTVLMALLAYYTNYYLDSYLNSNVSLIVSIICAIIFYILSVYILKVNELIEIKNEILKFFSDKTNSTRKFE